MKILFVTTRPPIPASGGAGLRGFHFIRHLAFRHEVHLVCHASVRQELELATQLDGACASITAIPSPAPRAMWRRAVETATSRLPDLAQRAADAAMGHALARTIDKVRPHIVHILGLEAAPAVFLSGTQDKAGLRRVLDELNAEFLLQQRAARVGLAAPRGWPGSAYSLVQSLKLRRFEQRLCGLAEGVLAVSHEDQRALQRIVPDAAISVVPNGVDTKFYHPREPALAPVLPGVHPGDRLLLFTGTMDFRPNVDAVTWFARDVLPRVRFAVPAARLAIVGREPPHAVRRLAGEGVLVTGSVRDDLPYFWRAEVFVLPMRFGGGSRLKLLQALACGMPVVTTSMGASGIDVQEGKDVMIADDPEPFAEHVIRALTEPAAAAALGLRARALALKYDWAGIVPQLERAYDEALARAPMR